MYDCSKDAVVAVGSFDFPSTPRVFGRLAV